MQIYLVHNECDGIVNRKKIYRKAEKFCWKFANWTKKSKEKQKKNWRKTPVNALEIATRLNSTISELRIQTFPEIRNNWKEEKTTFRCCFVIFPFPIRRRKKEVDSNTSFDHSTGYYIDWTVDFFWPTPEYIPTVLWYNLCVYRLEKNRKPLDWIRLNSVWSLLHQKAIT